MDLLYGLIFINSPLPRLCSLPFPLCVTVLTTYPNSPLSNLVASSSHTDSSGYMALLHGLVFILTASFYSGLFVLTLCLWPTYVSLFLLTTSMNFFVFPYFAESFALMVLATLLGLL